jgi:hypothetical protein
MLGFRSEAEVDEWCERRKLPRRPLLTLKQQWRLAVEWYGNRLTEESRRPGPAEMRRIFAEIGLTDPFWDPQADPFA